ncbi:hypothetical protein PENTCL1PPCAC_23307, partial [Pristionchus entomophagus]
LPLSISHEKGIPVNKALSIDRLLPLLTSSSFFSLPAMALLEYAPFVLPVLREFGQVVNSDIYPHGIPFPYKRHTHNSLDFGSALGEVESTPEKFTVTVDVFHFKPEDIKVSVKGKTLTIEGHHEERTDHDGTIQRSFIRKYSIPDDADLDSLHCSVSHKGHLKLEAHKMTKPIPLPDH